MMRKVSWLVMAVVVIAGLAIGVTDDDGPRTSAERAHDLASTVRCPTCRSQSAADSDAPAAKAVRLEIARRIDGGQTDAEIRSYLVSRFGEDILLTPSRSGIAGLVWVLPVVVFVVGVGTVVLVLRRWQERGARVPTDADRARVERELGDTT